MIALLHSIENIQSDSNNNLTLSVKLSLVDGVTKTARGGASYLEIVFPTSLADFKAKLIQAVIDEASKRGVVVTAAQVFLPTFQTGA